MQRILSVGCMTWGRPAIQLQCPEHCGSKGPPQMTGTLMAGPEKEAFF